MPTTPNKAVDVIRKINAGNAEYELSSRYLHTEDNLHDYTVEDLLNLVGAGIQLIVDEKHSSKDEPATAPSADTLGKIYLVKDNASLVGAHVEFITVKGETDSYSWEKIGTTTADLSDYAKTGTKTSSNNGGHTHTVSGKVAVTTVSKTSKKLSAKASGTTVSTTTDSAVTGYKADGLDDEVLGSGTTFTANVTPTTKNIAATATGTAVKTTSATVLKGLGKATTGSAVTGFNNDAGIATVATGYNEDAATGDFLTTGTTVSASGGVATIKHIKATATGTAVKTTPEEVVDTVTPTTQKMETTSIKGVSGSTTADKVTVSAGKAASWGASVNGEGVLSFTWSTNTPTSVSKTPVTVPVAAAATTVATGSISANGAGSSVVTAVKTTPVSVIKAVSVSAQPTITISEGTASDFAVVTSVSKVSASIKHVTGKAVTALPTLSTASVIDAMPTAKTDTFVKSYAAPATESVLKTASVSAQPTIDLSYVEAATDKTIAAMTGVTVGVEHDGNDNVTAITKVPALATKKFVTGVSVSAQPTITLEDTGSTGIDFVQTVTIGSADHPIKEVSVSTAGAHTHITSI